MFQVDFSKALSEVSVLLKTNVPTLMGLEKVCSILRKHIEHYDWVGFYFANHKEKVLILESYAGNPTDHTKFLLEKVSVVKLQFQIKILLFLMYAIN